MVTGLEPATEGSLLISGWIGYPLCERCPEEEEEENRHDQNITRQKRQQRNIPQQVDLRLPGPPSGQGDGREFEPATEGPLHISGRIRYPLCHRRSPIDLEYES
ncbi:hypothetical protein PoB_004275300 [Plakobranchus ocellatus]|uniref:Uncharacterized protein n=1 Tax=Plakobranchus ocellatus TaxID=259542 RepID=A0AAV4BAS0_9GAST|nr:hypothetical protein PoB_004275300 [Plakobranchus ocellatus]